MQRIVPAIVVTLMGTPAFTQHAAHVHGTGSMNLAVEGKLLSIDLVVPANDLVGFEHEPSDGADRAAVEKARDSLTDGGALLGVPAAAGCTLDKVDVRSALLDGEDDHDHARDKDHDDEKHDEHANGDRDEEAHSEFRAEYRFTCTKPEELTSLRPTFFEVFPQAESLKVQGITGTGQISAELTKDKPRLKLSD